MKGKYKVIVQNNRLHYELEIRRNITIIQGNSATGKTTLVNMLRQEFQWNRCSVRCAMQNSGGNILETDS